MAMDAATIASILAGHAVRSTGGNYVVRCPCHDDRTPSLSLRDADDGKLLVRCFAGCDPVNVLAEIRARTGSTGERIEAAPPPPKGSRDYERRQRDKAAWLWTQRQPIAGTVAETYLRQARGITCELPPTLAFLPPRKPEHHPALISAFGLCDVTDGTLTPPTEITAVHITKLQRDGMGKAGEPSKITVGSPGGKPIIIADAADALSLYIVEGIEDALSYASIVHTNIWAAGAAPFLPKLADAVPLCMFVTVLADHDPAGERNAALLVDGLHVRGMAAEMRPTVGDGNHDANDVLREQGVDGLRQAFDQTMRQQQPPQQPHHKGNGKTSHFLSKEEFLSGFMPPDYLIEGMLQRRFIYSLTGQTGHAKTAIALLIAEMVSRSEYMSLGSHRVQKGRVIYFVGENPDDVRMRVIGADSRRADNPLLDQITFVPNKFKIDQMLQIITAHAQHLGGVDLAIIDTSAAYFFGDDEVSNTQIGAHARSLRTLTTLPGGPCVLVLCHPIKYVIDSSQLLPRGGGAFLAEMDGNLTAWRKDDMIELHHNKMRGPGFEPMNFKLETIYTPKLIDKQGRELPTVQAIALSRNEEEQQEAQTTEDEDRVLAALLADPDLTIAEIAERNNWLTERGEPQKSKVHRIITRLEKSRPAQVRKNRHQWELTDEGKKTARKAALDFEQMERNPGAFR